MSILDKDFNGNINMLGVKINSEHPIRVSDFTESLAALNHLYSQVAKSQKNVKRLRTDQPHELSIDSIGKCCILICLIESNPIANISCIAGVLDLILNVINYAQTVRDSKKKTQLMEEFLELERRRLESDKERLELEKARIELEKEGIEISKKQLEELKDIKKLFGLVRAPGDSIFLSFSDAPRSAKMDYETKKHLEKTIEDLIKLGTRIHNRRKKK